MNMKENNQNNQNKNTEPNRKLAAMSCITICLSVLLMNVGRLEGTLPDWAVRTSGVGLMLCTVFMVILVVKSFAGYSKEKHGNNDGDRKE